MHTPRSRAWLLTHFLRTRRRRALSCLAWPPATATPPPTVSNAGRLNPATCDPACWERLQPLVTHRGELEAATAYILRLQPYLTQATRVTARAATRVTIGWLPQSRRAACAPILPVAACTTAYHCVCTYTYCMRAACKSATILHCMVRCVCAACALRVRCVCAACALRMHCLCIRAGERADRRRGVHGAVPSVWPLPVRLFLRPACPAACP